MQKRSEKQQKKETTSGALNNCSIVERVLTRREEVKRKLGGKQNKKVIFFLSVFFSVVNSTGPKTKRANCGWFSIMNKLTKTRSCWWTSFVPFLFFSPFCLFFGHSFFSVFCFVLFAGEKQTHRTRNVQNNNPISIQLGTIWLCWRPQDQSQKKKCFTKPKKRHSKPKAFILEIRREMQENICLKTFQTKLTMAIFVIIFTILHGKKLQKKEEEEEGEGG